MFSMRPSVGETAKAGETFDIIICDPPTAAQGADKKASDHKKKQANKGWLSRRDYQRDINQISLSTQRLLYACNGGKQMD